MFSECGFKNVRFERCRLREASLTELRAKKGAFEVSGCDLARAVLFRTPLAGLDLTTCIIEGAALEGPELRGAVVTAQQACELARLLGVIIK